MNVPEAALLCDIDGTLVDEAGDLFDGATALMATCRDVGVAVALCSPRPTRSMQKLAATLDAPRFIATLQGAVVLADESSGSDRQPWQVLAEHHLEREHVEVIARAAGPRPVWWYTRSEWLIDEQSQAATIEAQILGYRWDGFTHRRHASGVCKMLIVDHASPNDVPRIIEAFGIPATCCESKSGYFEIVPTSAGPDKGLSVIRSALTEASGRRRPSMLAVGDGLNDLGLLQAADHAVTFADAPAPLHAVASTVLPAERPAAMHALATLVRESVSPPSSRSVKAPRP